MWEHLGVKVPIGWAALPSANWHGLGLAAPSRACSSPASGLGNLVLALPQPLCAHGQDPAPLSLFPHVQKNYSTPHPLSVPPSPSLRVSEESAKVQGEQSTTRLVSTRHCSLTAAYGAEISPATFPGNRTKAGEFTLLIYEGARP